MRPQAFKLLSATTALIAATSAANAEIVSSPIEGTVFISQTTTGTLGVNAQISATSSPAIEISSSIPNVIISNTSTIRTNVSGPAVLLRDNSGINTVTINNSGTIIGAGGVALDLNEQNASNNDIDITIHNHGTIEGDIETGNGDVIYTGVNATQNGNITAGNGTNVIILNNSRMVGDYTGGTGADTFTITNSTVSGTLAGGTGTNQLNIDGNRTFTLQKGSLINGFQTINVDTDVVLNDGVTGAAIVNVAAAKTLTVNNDTFLANSGVVNNDGKVLIGGGKTLRVDDYVANAGSTLGIGLEGAASIGRLQFRTGSSNGLTATSVTIHVGDNSGFITSGTRINFVDGDDTSIAPTLLTSGTGVYRFSTVTAGNDVDLVIGRVSTASVITGKVATTVANTMDNIGTSATDELRRAQSAIGQAPNPAAVQRAVDSLAPSIDGAGIASLNVAVGTGNQISNRLASIRQDYNSSSGVATGDPLATSNMWIQGLGSTVTQDDKDGHYGYDATSAGMSVGIDTDTMVDGVTTGLAVTYAKSTVDSNSTSNASTDVNTFAATLYGSRVFDMGFFINGQVGAGYNQYETSRNVVGVGTANGETNGLQGNAKLEAGQDLAMGAITVTPLASVQYTYLDMDKYTETGVGNAGLTVTPDAMSAIDAAVGLKLAYAVALADGGSFIPSVHAKYIKRLGDRELASTSSFIGAAGTAFNTTGIESDDASINLGLGLLLTTVNGTDLSLNYDADIRDSLTGHTGQVKARWAF